METGRDYEGVWSLLHEVLIEHVDLNEVEYSTHAKERMSERSITKAAAETILKYGKPVEMFAPFTYPYGERPLINRTPVFTVVGYGPEGKIAVGLAIEMKKTREAHFLVMTVINDLTGRHAAQ